MFIRYICLKKARKGMLMNVFELEGELQKERDREEER